MGKKSHKRERKKQKLEKLQKLLESSSSSDSSSSSSDSDDKPFKRQRKATSSSDSDDNSSKNQRKAIHSAESLTQDYKTCFKEDSNYYGTRSQSRSRSGSRLRSRSKTRSGSYKSRSKSGSNSPTPSLTANTTRRASDSAAGEASNGSNAVAGGSSASGAGSSGSSSGAGSSGSSSGASNSLASLQTGTAHVIPRNVTIRHVFSTIKRTITTSMPRNSVLYKIKLCRYYNSTGCNNKTFNDLFGQKCYSRNQPFIHACQSCMQQLKVPLLHPAVNCPIDSFRIRNNRT